MIRREGKESPALPCPARSSGNRDPQSSTSVRTASGLCWDSGCGSRGMESCKMGVRLCALPGNVGCVLIAAGYGVLRILCG